MADARTGRGWGHEDVLPYFKKAEGNTRLGDPFHGTDGPLHVEDRRYNHELTGMFIDSAVATGFKRNDDFNGAEQEGVGLYQVTCRKGRRWSVADAYIRPASNRPNLICKRAGRARFAPDARCCSAVGQSIPRSC